MKSKPNTHSQQAPGKKHTVSILISLTESRNMASVTHHLPSLLSLCGVEKDGEEVVLVGVKRGKLLEIEDMDRKGQRTLGFIRNSLLLSLSPCILCSMHLEHSRTVVSNGMPRTLLTKHTYYKVPDRTTLDTSRDNQTNNEYVIAQRVQDVVLTSVFVTGLFD